MNTSILSNEQQAFLDAVTTSFAVSDDVLNSIVTRAHAELFRGLSTTSHGSELLMKPTFIRAPVARSSSVSLGMSISASGSRIRITSINVDAKSTPTRTHTQVFTAQSNEQCVFDFVAYCVREFVQQHKLDSVSVPLGVTVGVPSGRHTEYAQGLHASDVGRKLCAAFVRSHLNVHVTSITHGAVSALVASRINKSTQVAAVFDAGVNAAYIEQLGQVTKLRVAEESKSSLVAIDTDIGNFGSRYNELPVTMWDRRVDRESTSPGRVFEKLAGGHYMGEIVRNLIIDMVDQRLLFTMCNVQEISIPYSFHTAYMGPIIDNAETVDAVFAAEFGIKCSESECRIIRTLCSIVMTRAARVAGAVLAAVVLKANADEVVLSGTVFDANPRMLEETVREMQSRLPKGVKTEVQSPSDELFGAAVNAACI
ncbi:hexokinase [Coemansia sp. RSA 1972]|nr:hexokinase [Coemansia sp. RSA 1972]